MSYNNNSQYLGAAKCCNLNKLGPQGAIGQRGPQGAIGPYGITGATGAGATGAQGQIGATGNPYWTLGNTGGLIGYTGIKYSGDVIISGKLAVSGGIDPTYLAMQNQLIQPFPTTIQDVSLNGIWFDTSNNLRAPKIYLDDPKGNLLQSITLQPNNTNQIILSDGSPTTELKNVINYNSLEITDGTDSIVQLNIGSKSIINQNLDMSGNYISNLSQIRWYPPSTQTSDFTISDSDLYSWFICNKPSDMTVTLPDPSTNIGREIKFKNVTANAVLSASNNIIQMNGGGPDNNILPGLMLGKWTTIVSDGTNWIKMQET